MPTHSEIAEFIWKIADHLRGDYEASDYEDVILPFTLLRRLDCVLEKTRDKVRAAEEQAKGKVTDDVLKKLLANTAGVPYYNRSKFSFTELLKDPANIKENFGAWLDGFSGNIKEILYNFSGGPEQQAIVAHIERETHKIDALTDKYRREMELLEEYRAALISHAVTGKIDVRDVVAAATSVAP